MTTLVSKEAADEQAKLEAKLSELQAKKINRQREVENQRQMLIRKQKADEEKAKQDALKIENERLQSLQDIKDEYTDLEKEKQAQTELQKVELEESAKLKELEDLNASEEAKQQIRNYYLSLKDEAREADYLKSKELKDKEEEDEQKLKDAKLSAQLELAAASRAGIKALGALFEEGTAGQAKNILSTVKGGGGSSPSSSGGRGAGSSQSAIPSFNVVGAAPENQLAQAIGQNDQQPIKAFVVSNEITNAQALERNIIEGASIG